jgi:hypothetical protein
MSLKRTKKNINLVGFRHVFGKILVRLRKNSAIKNTIILVRQNAK